MTARLPIDVDLAILGGGIAGLWLLREATERGYACVLVESDTLGAGQSIVSQGILHGGVKYTLDGIFSSSADAIREMPTRWLASLSGQRSPDLRAAALRADHCHLWRTSSLSSIAGMIGAKVGLRVRPARLEKLDWPAALAGCPGEVFRLDEPVIDVGAVLSALAAPVEGCMVRGALTRADLIGFGSVTSLFVEHAAESQGPTEGPTVEIRPRNVILTAGAGNAALRGKFGLAQDAMQRRPLHMVMARGRLPTLNGHCTDGAATRVTITTARDSADRTVWQIGGQLAEAGVPMETPDLVRYARDEIAAVLPGVNLATVEWSGYRIDRAEAATESGKRPTGVWVERSRNVITAWPTKLVLAPRLADEVLALCDKPAGNQKEAAAALAGLPRPAVAQPPWEWNLEWTRAH